MWSYVSLHIIIVYSSNTHVRAHLSVFGPTERKHIITISYISHWIRSTSLCTHPFPIPFPSLSHPFPIIFPSLSHPFPIPFPSFSHPFPITFPADPTFLPTQKFTILSNRSETGWNLTNTTYLHTYSSRLSDRKYVTYLQLWPDDEVPRLRSAGQQFSQQCWTLAQLILLLMGHGLGLDVSDVSRRITLGVNQWKPLGWPSKHEVIRLYRSC